MVSLIFEVQKNDTNGLTYRFTDIENKFMVTNGERGAGGRDKLGVQDQQTHTVAYKTGNPTVQGKELYLISVISHNGKVYDK